MRFWLRELGKDVRCLLLHWHRVRNAYTNTCVTCGRDWA